MTLIRPLLAALALAALFPVVDVTPAEAQEATCRPWCVNYSTRGGATNCGFVSFEQCMQTAQGADFCVPNGFCPPSSAGRSDRRRR